MSRTQAHGEGQSADRRLNGRLRRIGEHAEQPLLCIEAGADNAEIYAEHAHDQREENDADDGAAALCGIPKVDFRADEDEEQDFRKDPQFGKFLRKPSRADLVPCKNHGTEGDDGDQIGEGDIVTDRLFQSDE